jgi:hypothetical protein
LSLAAADQGDFFKVHAFGVQGEGIGRIKMGMQGNPGLTIKPGFGVVETHVKPGVGKIVDMGSYAAVDLHFGICAVLGFLGRDQKKRKK